MLIYYRTPTRAQVGVGCYWKKKWTVKISLMQCDFIVLKIRFYVIFELCNIRVMQGNSNIHDLGCYNFDSCNRCLVMCHGYSISILKILTNWVILYRSILSAEATSAQCISNWCNKLCFSWNFPNKCLISNNGWSLLALWWFSAKFKIMSRGYETSLFYIKSV